MLVSISVYLLISVKGYSSSSNPFYQLWRFENNKPALNISRSVSDILELFSDWGHCSNVNIHEHIRLRWPHEKALWAFSNIFWRSILLCYSDILLYNIASKFVQSNSIVNINIYIYLFIYFICKL